MSAEPPLTDSNSKVVTVAIIGAAATITAAVIGAVALILSNRPPEPSPTVEPPVTVEPSATAEPLPTVEPSATVEPSPTVEVVQIDPMDDLASWGKYLDDQGSTLEISSKPGRVDHAIELLFNLNENGWVGIMRDVSPGVLAGSDGLAFYLRGSGEPNTIELKLIYAVEDAIDTVFSVSWHAVTVTGDWVRLEAYYDEFICWEETGCEPGSVPDPARVSRIDFAVSNKPGDVPGIGVVLLDSIEAIRR